MQKPITRRTAIKQAAIGTMGLGILGTGVIGCSPAAASQVADKGASSATAVAEESAKGSTSQPMNILVLNGSPHKDGNTIQMIDAFKEGAESAGHTVNVVNCYDLDFKACIGCESCLESGECVQDDDFSNIVRPLIDEADMRVLASPVHYLGFSGPLQSAIGRFRAPAYVGCYSKMNKQALILSSQIDNYYGGITFTHLVNCSLLGMKSMGIFTAPGCIYTQPGHEDEAAALLEELKTFGASL